MGELLRKILIMKFSDLKKPISWQKQRHFLEKLVEIIATNDTSNKTLLNTACEGLNIIFSEKFGKKAYGS